MADLSKIKLNGVEYNLKDDTARKKSNILQVRGGYYNDSYDWWDLEIAATALNSINNAPGSSGMVQNIYIANGQLKSLILQNPLTNYGKTITITLPTQTGTLALVDNIPTKTSDLTNDSGFITTAPTVEDMANVTAMLASYGLNTTTTLSAAAAGTAELDSAVVQNV